MEHRQKQAVLQSFRNDWTFRTNHRRHQTPKIHQDTAVSTLQTMKTHLKQRRYSNCFRCTPPIKAGYTATFRSD